MANFATELTHIGVTHFHRSAIYALEFLCDLLDLRMVVQWFQRIAACLKSRTSGFARNSGSSKAAERAFITPNAAIDICTVIPAMLRPSNPKSALLAKSLILVKYSFECETRFSNTISEYAQISLVARGLKRLSLFY